MRFAIAFAMGLLTATGTLADVANGAALAGEWCARCHDTSASGEMKTMPPSFASIAAFRAAEQIQMRIMFPSMHSSMPAWATMHSPDEVDDLVAYIQALEGVE